MKMNPILKDVLKNLKIDDLYKKGTKRYGLSIYTSHIQIEAKMRPDRLLPPSNAFFLFSNYGYKNLREDQLIDVANFISNKLKLEAPQIEKLQDSGILLYLNCELKDWE